MSVRYTATWYDVTQARQQAHTPYTQTRTGPAGRSSLTHTDTHTPDRQQQRGVGGRLNSSVCLG